MECRGFLDCTVLLTNCDYTLGQFSRETLILLAIHFVKLRFQQSLKELQKSSCKIMTAWNTHTTSDLCSKFFFSIICNFMMETHIIMCLGGTFKNNSSNVHTNSFFFQLFKCQRPNILTVKDLYTLKIYIPKKFQKKNHPQISVTFLQFRYLANVIKKVKIFFQLCLYKAKQGSIN